MVKVLVLGATGFIGGQIAKKAHQAGWEVHGFRRDPQSEGLLTGFPIQWHTGTLEEYPSLVEAMTGMDYTFHAAASYPKNSKPSRVNDNIHAGINQMNNVIQATRQAQVSRLIYTSSISTIGLPPAGEERLADERDLYQPGTLPDNGYYETKSAMEDVARGAAREGSEVVILNPSLVLGPGDIHLSTGDLVVAIARGLAIAVPQGVVNIIDVRDAAEAHLEAALNGKSGERYILGGDNYSVREAAEIISRAAGVKPPRFNLSNKIIDLYIKIAETLPFIPYPLDHLRAYRAWQGYETGKARQELGLQTRPLAETARESIDWFKQQGILK